MAAVPITIVGIQTDDNGSRNVTISGMASLTGLGVGGGPAEPPPGIWPSPGHPAHPIAPGGPPPGVWPWPGRPAHPIAPGGPPPGIWPGPGAPAHPIVLPPDLIPGLPPNIGIWPSPGVPTHPIVLPPPGSPPDQKPDILENWDVKTAWTAETGWIVAIVPSESHPGVPTPSAT
jgi:hypothetical protein